MINLQKEYRHYINYCLSQKELSHHTIKAYSIDLEQFLNFQNNMTLSKNDITMYIKHLHTKYKPKSIHRKIASLKAFVHYLYYEDIVEENPFDKIDTSFKEPLILPRTIPEYLINRMLCAAYNNINTALSEYEQATATRNAAILELLFATGARVFEICSLKTEDIDLVAQNVKILGKGSKERIIQIENSDVISILKQYKVLYEDYLHVGGFFFLNNRNMRFSEQSVRTIIQNLEKQIHSDIHITPHMFRHSVATMLLEEDVDIRYIQKILGHSSITTTQIYTHVTSAKQKEILRTKHPRNRMKIS